MEERPERAVGIAVVIFRDVLRLEVDRRGGEAIGARHGQLAGEMLDLLARPAEPDAAMLAQRAVHRDREPALRAGRARSEEHTSDLQSLMRISYAVFCLKNNKKTKLPQHKAYPHTHPEP